MRRPPAKGFSPGPVWQTTQSPARARYSPLEISSGGDAATDEFFAPEDSETVGIIKDLIEAGHWDEADKYLTERYIQHNPLAASGRAGVVKYFTEVVKAKPVPIPEKMKSKIVAVLAQGDLVVVAYVRERQDSKDPTQKYTTTWFDMWRFKDGKADEHWDPATR